VREVGEVGGKGRDLKRRLVLTFGRRAVKGIQESARLLNSVLPTTQYDIVDTVIGRGGGASVTKRWGYHDVANNLQVIDGVDTFLIVDGKMRVKMIHYTVERRADTRADYERKIGLDRG
jgi:hypothetical protein